MNQANQPKINQEELRRQLTRVSQELEQFNVHRQNRINQLTALSSYLETLKAAKDTISELQRREPGEKIMFPLTSLFFVPLLTSEETTEEILINLRSGIFKKGNISSAEAYLDKEIKSVSESVQSLQKDIDKTNQEIRQRENFLAQFYMR